MSGTQNGFHLKLIIIFFVSSFAIFGLLKSISDHVDERDISDYLISLRENSTAGCLSFYERDSNILVVGDSHTYAGFDFYKFSQLAGTSKISACMMGGLYFDSLVDLIEKLPQFESIPGNIVFGLSLRQFTTGSDRESQLQEHGKLIHSMGISLQNIFLKIKKNLDFFLKDSLKRGSLELEREQDLNKWQPVLAGLDVKKVDYVFNHLNHGSKDSWKKYLAQLQFLDSNDANILRFCEVIKKNDIRLFLVDIPESPYLQSLYKASDITKYSEIIQKLSQCSKKVVRLTNDEWGLDNRHFLNRSLSSKWDFEQLYSKLDHTPADQKILAFDLDHLNLVGAQIVTDKTFNQIKDDLKHAF